MVAAYAAARLPKYALPPQGRGVDGLGLLTGALAMAGLSTSVENLAGVHPASSLDAYWRTGTMGTDALRFSREDLEKCSIIVPTLGELRAGDLVLHYGEAEGQSPDPLRVGVVVYVPSIGRPLPGQDSASFLAQILVVSAQEGSRQVRLASWNDSFGSYANEVHLRRIVRATATAGARHFDFRVGALTSDMLDLGFAASRLELGATYDHSYKGVKEVEKQKWIPNTGQYLEIQSIALVFENFYGAKIKLNNKLQGQYYLRILAEDRGYDPSAASDNNIRNNMGAGFEVAAKPTNGFDTAAAIKIGNLELDPLNKRFYKMTASAATSDAFSGNLTLNAGWKLALDVAERVNLTGPGGIDSTVFGIRPIAGQKLCPGDDILIRISVLGKADGREIVTVSSSEKDYLAVYDKKMLWRANLYIDEGVGKDWNELHPWNAAPAAGNAPIGGTPAWWREEWGYNEWNREFKNSTSFANGKTVGLANLPAGDGKQVIELMAFTPLRTIPVGSETNPNTSNKLNGTVAYSYPSHPKEATGGNAGSMDSPFDFAWKMRVQEMGQQATYGGIAGAKATLIPNIAHQNQWKNYVKGIAQATQYIPSLGLFYGFSTSVNNEAPWNAAENATNPITDAAYWKWEYTFEAGTDCIGFVKRAMSFRDRNPYTGSTFMLDGSFMETGASGAGSSDPAAVQTSTAAGERTYPVQEGDAGAAVPIVHNRSGYEVEAYRKTTGELSDSEKVTLLDSLRRIVPGDIWVKDTSSTDDPNGDAWKDHIAIVAKIPDNSYSINDPATYMDQMILIEGEYTSKIQSVIKKLSVGDYNAGKLVGPREIYGKLFEIGKEDSLDLKCQSWAIRRLK
jgi:hypothetical protein